MKLTSLQPPSLEPRNSALLLVGDRTRSSAARNSQFKLATRETAKGPRAPLVPVPMRYPVHLLVSSLDPSNLHRSRGYGLEQDGRSKVSTLCIVWSYIGGQRCYQKAALSAIMLGNCHRQGRTCHHRIMRSCMDVYICSIELPTSRAHGMCHLRFGIRGCDRPHHSNALRNYSIIGHLFFLNPS